MKFLCPQCKAKYQIADEKVAGRTLKMDCRRCGHTIMLRGDQAEPEEQTTAAPEASVPPARASAPSRGAAAGRPGALPQPGPAAAAPARRTGAPARSGSHVGPSPARPAPRSALSADFRRSAAGGAAPSAPEAPRNTPLDQWHVAINDVPVGPMRRDEISRKISTGAIHAESLAWREGFDDWRPLREIPELAALFRRSAPQAEPARPPAGRMPAAPARPPAAASRPGAARPATGRPEPRAAEPARPAARSNVVAIGGRHGASAAPAIDEDESLEEIDGEPTRVASSLDLTASEMAAAEKIAPSAAAPARKSTPPAAAIPAVSAPVVDVLPDPFPAAPPRAPSAAGTSSPGMSSPGMSSPGMPAATTVVPPVAPAPPRERERRGLPVGAWIGIAGAMSFGIAMAVMLAPRLLGPSSPAAVAAVATTDPAASAPVAPVVEATVDPVAPPSEPAVAEVIPAPAETTPVAPVTGEHHATKRVGTSGTTTTTTGTGTGATAATKTTTGSSVFDRFEDDGAGAAAIATRPAAGTETTRTAGAGELTATQIRTVVSREQRGLQACWELAIRGMRDVPTTRLDVDVTIGASGTVTSATARGVGVGNLSECIERNVRRWRFPASGDSSRTSFPVVFQSAG